MNVKKKARRVMSGLLTAVTVLSTVLSPAVAYASDDAGSVKKIPYYEEIKDQLDEDEVVTAKDYEIKVGDNFDVKSDYTGLTIQDDSKVKVTFQEAKDTDGNDFSTDYANSYKAVYYVEPQTTNHPTYQINRKIVVKEADQQKDSQSESSSDQDAGSSDETETEDSEADSSTEEIGAAETESKTELTEKEFDAEIEATENQETVDPETGITLSEVMQEAVDQEVALADLEAGESITFDMPMMLASGETGTKSVTVTAGSWYYYADYGLGSYLTCPYYVKWGSINATAYCVEPSKKGPGNGTYTIQKLADGKTLAKVCYYGTKASDENGFFDEKHPDFPAGKRFIITHLAAAYANGSSDWASGTNATGKNLAMELYNYCVNMPDIPSVDMSFSESNVKAYVEGNSQRTSVITFKADKLQTITFKLPKGVKLVNVTTGKTSAAGANVEISGGTKFYLTASLNQAENVSATFSSKMKGSIDKEYSAYKITTGFGTQDLALVFGEGVGNEKYVDFKVTWTKECKVSIVKKDQDTGNALAGAVYGMGNTIGAVSYLQILAPELTDKMLAEFLDIDKNLIVNLHVQSVDQMKAIKLVKSKVTDINRMKIEEQKKAVRAGYDMDIIPSDLNTYGGEAKRLLEDLQSRNERMFLVTALFLNTAKTKQALDNAIFQTAGIAQKYNCVLKRLDYQQEEGLMSSVPLGVNHIPIKRALTTTSTAIFVPFTTQELFMAGESLYYGLNALSNNMIMVDRKKLKNPNGLILGTPGSGKSFAAKREITNAFFVTKDDIIIGDPEGEYYPLVHALGGQVVHISPTSKDYINPMDINMDYSDDDNPLGVKSDFVLSLCELIMGSRDGIEAEEKSVIDRCLPLVYQKYFADPKPENMPILGDLYDCLRKQKEPQAQRIATALEIYVNGSLKVFNHRTNVELNNRIVCFDIKELGKQLKKIGMLIVQDQVWNRVTINRGIKSTRYYIDEFHRTRRSAC